MVASLLTYFEDLAMRIPLELVVLVGTFVEEVLSPLPSFLVLVPSGAAARLQGESIWYLGILCLFSGVGRIAGGLLLYWVADKSEDLVLRRGRKVFGVSHAQIERFGRRLGKSGSRDWMLLFLMNAIPVFPTAVLSLACGFVKVPLRMFVTATFLGTLINAAIYLGIGYAGSVATTTLSGLETATQITSVALIIIILIWVMRRQRKLKAAVATELLSVKPKRKNRAKNSPKKKRLPV